MAPDVSTIQPGSILLYSSPSVVDWIIERTGPAAHVEWYEGNGKSLASRNGLGVNRYDFRAEGLIGVVVPVEYDVADFSAWFETVKGDGYDFRGLEGFLVGRQTNEPHHEFCSAFIALGRLRTKRPLFNRLWPWSLITPTDFFKSAMCVTQWVDTTKFPV